MPIQSTPPPLSFISKYNGRSNKLINKVFITSPEILTPTTQIDETSQYLALWDTGATNTAISSKVATECNLLPIGIAEVFGVSGSESKNVYLVNIFLPNKVFLPNLKVTEAVLKDCDVLVGMDVIGLGDFAVCNHKGITTFSYRYPSIEMIDFVHKTPITNPNKPGRNSICPCGSGKKYKNCCGK